MKSHKKPPARILGCLLGTLILSSAATQSAFGQAVTTAFTFQGVLKNSGSPINGQVDLQFRLYDAAVGGSQVGLTLSLNGVSLTDGLLTTSLDFGVTAFGGSQRWLQISVSPPNAGGGPFTALTPRQPMTAVPYAMFALAGSGQWTPNGTALNYTPGNVSVGTTSQNGKVTIYPNAGGGGTQTGLYVRNTDTSNQYSVSNFISDSPAGIGVQASVASGNSVGRAISAVSGASLGMGVYAQNSATTGTNYGVYGRADSTAGIGVYGLASSASGTNIGIYGNTNSNAGYAGFFNGRVYCSSYVGIGEQDPIWPLEIQSLGGVGADVEVTGTTADAVIGRVTAATGTTVGVRGETSSSSGKGVWGRSLSASGVSYGGYFEAASTSGRAVRAIATGATGAPIAVYASTTSVTGYGIYSDADQNYFLSATDVEPSSGGIVVIGQVSSGNIGIDGNEIMARNNGATSTLYLNNDGGNVSVCAGGTGTLITPVLQITGGADLSENFEVSDVHAEPLPGMVVVIDPANPGHLMPASGAYDKKVAGIISGAGGVATGMTMGHSGTIADGAHAVALTGRVYCLVDATDAAIEPGDLLTTSETLGHAMKAIDVDRSHGAIIGKAMTALPRGEKGLVLVLVNLQ